MRSICDLAFVFLQGLGMYSTQSQASVALGACIAGAAIIGTPIGGWLLDWEVKRRWVSAQMWGLSGSVFRNVSPLLNT